MTKHTITADFHSSYEINRAGDDWTFTEKFSVLGGDLGIHVAAKYDDTTITMAGTASGKQAALYSEADNVDIDVTDTGKLTGKFALVVKGNHLDVVNQGQISGVDGGAVVLDASRVSFRNEGNISAEFGVAFTSGTIGVSNAELCNGKHGQIIGSLNGIQIDSSFGINTRVENHGRVTGTMNALVSAAGNESVVNDGTMKGEITLGDGNDRFDNRGGFIANTDGGVRGGFGQDTLITDSAKVKLIEVAAEGIHDTVRTTVSYRLSANVENLVLLGSNGTNATGTNQENVIHGNSGDNVIKGLLGLDELYGGQGTDVLIGGGDGDRFHFSTEDGHDTVMDFEHGLDVVDLSGWTAISSFDDLTRHHIKFANGDAMITAGKDSLTLRGVAETDLDAGDLFFAM
jgi:Ca2+-binding RTX toxin-like protein